MASKVETSFGFRLAKAQELASHLESFSNYIPVAPDFSLAAYQQLIANIFESNSQVAEALSHFSRAADERQQTFCLSPEGMIKRLPFISGYVRALFGKKSVEVEMVSSKINKIRGVKTNKLKKDQEGEFISQSQASYGSMIQNYSNLIDTLISFGASYSPPATSKIGITTLQALMTQMNNSTETVNHAYGALKIAQDKRLGQYTVLHSRSLRIKETVKALYGVSSAEYKLIKGLKI